MSFYLVDYENAKNLSGISNLSPDDHVIIFYSKNADSLPIDIHKEILSAQAKIEFKHVEVGKNNALDFQLDSYLGYVICQNESSDCKYYIVAKDGGYSCVAAFWKQEKSIDIQIISGLTGDSQTTDKKTPAAKKTPQKAAKESAKTVKKKPQKAVKKSTAPNGDAGSILKESNPGLSDTEISEIVSLLETETNQTFNSELNKLLKNSTRAGEVLKVVKPFIKKSKAVNKP